MLSFPFWKRLSFLFHFANGTNLSEIVLLHSSEKDYIRMLPGKIKGPVSYTHTEIWATLKRSFFLIDLHLYMEMGVDYEEVKMVRENKGLHCHAVNPWPWWIAACCSWHKLKLCWVMGSQWKVRLLLCELPEQSMWVRVCACLGARACLYGLNIVPTPRAKGWSFPNAYMPGTGFMMCRGRALQARTCLKIWMSSFLIFIR